MYHIVTSTRAEPCRNSGPSPKVSALAHSEGGAFAGREPFARHSPSSRIPFAMDGTQTCTRLLALRENFWDSCFSKLGEDFSGTGPSRQCGLNAANFDKIGALLVTYLIIKTSWRRIVDSNRRYRSFSSNKLRISAYFERLPIPN